MFKRQGRDFGKGFDLNVATRGEGLGLVSMRERLKSVNGHLSIESKPGHGTTVMARAPLQLAKTTRRVLLVDDFQPWREELRPIIERERLLNIVGEAANGREAIEKANELRPDLVLLDLALPDVSGVQVARSIVEECPSCKIIVVSSHNDAGLAKEITSEVAQGYLLKSECQAELAFANAFHKHCRRLYDLRPRQHLAPLSVVLIFFYGVEFYSVE